MKQILKTTLIGLIFLFNSCDTNDNNDPTVDCDANFYSMASTHWDSFTGNYEIYQYQKSNVLSTPISLTTNNNFKPTSGILNIMNSCINTNLGEIVYHFSETPSLYKFNMNTNTMSDVIFHGWKNPEYIGNTLSFLRTENITMSGSYMQNGDCTILDEQGNSISQTFQNIDFSNSGAVNRSYFTSTSNNQNELFYLANTKLIIYDNTNDSWSDFDLEIYNETTNKIVFLGLEYVTNNILYALRGDLTDTNNISLELIKIDINGGAPQISVLKDLTNQLSISSSVLLTNKNWISSSYDLCDDSYYFSYADMSNISSIVFEIKLISDVINEYPVNGKLLYGLDKD